MDRQSADPYTKKSLADGYRSRAAYKLIEINQKHKIFKKSTKNIVDLGFAPGAWTQVALAEFAKLGLSPKILGVDLINCAPPPGSHFIEGDIFSRKTHQEIDSFFSEEGIDVVLSDMMCNSTGNGELDHYGSMDICEGVLILTNRLLRQKGTLVMKYFSGSQDREMRQKLEKMFDRVFTMKPHACRQSLREMYMIGLGKRIQKSNKL
ncbi:23S ribosomal RNA methyltransferase [Metschnikowia bicuspidata var. bicuspidata NRRL YB-4993]|uniref:rRNA methyltransferase 2, mitochondrial n=1 Tax=Metschnikowia bicuspidata var. bicuspidata NRRL YB-4993 TaxID=869754 RepID=A0A1A0HIY2_9ASCO|nr:23S ribosomal RNA methyltransferase [Metschnikowia bicuspidata var. bicuspidata NRRL YB-4993]OBA23961.1 23S ribosomal RNA methyltransferase [Metschnikowia bicuspidata var. bicuspidata NRRL YB-4993]